MPTPLSGGMAVKINLDSQRILLTVADLRRWTTELHDIDEQIERLSDERTALARKLNAVSVLFDGIEQAVGDVEDNGEGDSRPSNHEPVVVPQSIARSSKLPSGRRRRRRADGPTWVSVILEGIQLSQKGLTYRQMREFAEKSPLSAKLAQSDKGYHNAISRLARDGVIIREHGRLFTPEAYKRFMADVEDGVASTSIPMPFAHSPMGEGILQIVLKKQGINGKSVIGELRKNPEFNATLTPHETGAYNIIARLVKRRQIIRRDDGGLIVGPDFPKDLFGQTPERDEALNGQAASASVAGEAATSPIENQTILRLIG